MTTSRTLGWSPTEIDGINLLQRNGLFDAGAPVQADLDWRFTKLVGFWAPRRWLPRRRWTSTAWWLRSSRSSPRGASSPTQAAESYEAMDQRRAIKALLRP